MNAPEWWPPSDGEPIGEERVQQVIAWLQQLAPVALEEARRQLPYGQRFQHAMPSNQLARHAFWEGMRGICIGALFGPGVKSQTRVVGISIQRNGRLAVTTALEDERKQRWVEV